MPPDFSYELEIGGVCVGIDEAGRGPLAGPVVAAAVILPPESVTEFAGLDDSKKLTATRREEFYRRLMAVADCGVGMGSVAEIESVNILQATFLAMQRAVANLTTGSVHAPIHALVDGNRDPQLNVPTTCVVKGDSRCLSIAAASVVAKHHRDGLMLELAEQYPDYGWHSNKGYGSKAHRDAIVTHGLTPHHRRSFCKNFIQD